jgi:hypothetical protein
VNRLDILHLSPKARKVAVALALLVAGLLFSQAAALAADSVFFEGESMSYGSFANVTTPGYQASGGAVLRYSSDGQADKSVRTTEASSAVVVKAKSAYASTSDIQMKVLVDGVHKGTKTVPLGATKLAEYSYAANIPAGSRTISVVGVDLAGENALIVDYVRLNAAASSPEPPPPSSDIDGDGVPDSEDQCDSQPGPASNNGCPVKEPPPTGSCTGTTVSPTTNLENVIDNPGNYCLRGGVYDENDGQITINADNVTVRNVPGERAEIRGRVRTNDGASNVRFIGSDVSANVEGIVLNSTYSPIDWSTSGGMGHFTSDPHLIRGNGTVFDNIELDGDNDVLGDPWYSSGPSTPSRAIGTCVLIADGTDGQPAADVQIVNSDIHNCGAAPDSRADNVGTHALYLSGGLRVQVEHNQIYENGTRGVQIRNGTDNTHVYGNVIDENYVGVGFDDPVTNGNIVENNVVTRNANKNIRNLSDAGTGNVARNNCGYGEPIPNGTDGNVSYSNNVTVSSNPYSVDPEPNADAKVGNSTCAAKLPTGSPFRP